MKRKVFIVVLVMLLCLCSCRDKGPSSGRENPAGTDVEREDIRALIGAATYNKDGVYSVANIARYVEKETGEEYVLCFDPTCEHQYPTDWKEEVTCAALYRAGASYLIPIDEGFYGVYQGARETSICLENTEGTERRVIAEVDMQTLRGMQYTGDQLLLWYRNDYDYGAMKEGDTEPPLLEKPLTGCVLISLVDGTVEHLVRKESETNYITDAYLVGDDLFYYYSEILEEDGVLKNFIKIFRYNISRKEETLVTEGKNASVTLSRKGIVWQQENPDADFVVSMIDWDKQLFWVSYDGRKTLVAEGETVSRGCFVGDRYIYYASEKQEEYTEGGYYACDLTKGETVYLGDAEWMSIEAVFSDGIFVMKNNEAGELMYCWISTEDFFAGAFDRIRYLTKVNVSHDDY